MPCARGCCPDQATHFRSIQFGGKPPSEQSRMEKRWSADMPAYKRLRRNGLQPKQIDGCSTLEKHASTKLEVKMGHLFRSPEDLKKAKEGMQRAQDMGLGVYSE